jgi:hypothetical protein
MPYTPRRHYFHVYEAKRDITLLSLNDSADFNNCVKTRSDILNERLSPKPNLLLTLSRLRNTRNKWLMKETDFYLLSYENICTIIHTRSTHPSAHIGNCFTAYSYGCKQIIAVTQYEDLFSVLTDVNDQKKCASQNQTFPYDTSGSQLKNSVGHLIFVT